MTLANPALSLKLNSQPASARLVERTVETLRSRILSGAYGLDGELPAQAELCGELGVSRVVVREAMQRLQSQRLLDVGRGRKPRVIPAGSQGLADCLEILRLRTNADWRDVIEVRRTLELEIVSLAALRATSDQIAELEAAVDAMEHSPTLEGQIAADFAFHRVLAQSSGNMLFAFMVDALANILRASQERTLSAIGPAHAIEDHRRIVAAIKKRQPPQARKMMERHLEETFAHLAPDALPTNEEVARSE